MTRWFTLSCAVLLMIPILAHSATPVDYRVHNLPESNRVEMQTTARDLIVVGDMLYVLNENNRLNYFDISDPSSPQHFQEMLAPGNVRQGVAATGGLWMAASTDGLAYFELDGILPRNPQLVPLPGDAWDVAVSSNAACVAARDAGLHVLTPDFPSTPELTVTLDLGAAVYNIANRGDIFYVSIQDGLVVLDISDPHAPVQLDVIVENNLRRPVVAGDELYLNDSNGLVIYDISTPAAPVRSGRLDLPSTVPALAVDGGQVHACSWGYGLSVVDASNPLDPRLVAVGATPDVGTAIALTADYALLGAHDGSLRSIPRRSVTRMPRIGHIEFPADALFVEAGGSLAVVGCSGGRFEVVDISDPSSPGHVGSVDLPLGAKQARIVGHHAYVQMGDEYSSSGPGIIVDLSDPSAPVATPSPAAGDWYSAEVWQDRLVAKDGYYIQVLDLADPQAPTISAVSDRLPEFPLALAVSGDHVVVALDGGGLLVLELATQGTLAVVAELPYLPEFRDLAVGKGKVYSVVNSWDLDEKGVVTVDLTDPTQPLAGMFLPVPYLDCADATVAGDFLYLAAPEGGLVACDIQDPEYPAIYSTWGASGVVQDVSVAASGSGPVLVTASTWAGLEIVPPQARAGSVARTPQATETGVVKVYPNPVNPRCEIAFSLRQPGTTSVAIFDIAGRRVADLIRNESLSAGPHSAVWSGQDSKGRGVASGVYFARVTGPGLTEVRKLVLAR